MQVRTRQDTRYSEVCRAISNKRYCKYSVGLCGQIQDWLDCKNQIELMSWFDYEVIFIGFVLEDPVPSCGTDCRKVESHWRKWVTGGSP